MSLRGLAIVVLAGLCTVPVGGSVAHAQTPRNSVPQVVSLRAPDDAVADAQRNEAAARVRAAALRQQHTTAAGAYAAKTAEVAALKAQRASWQRDRKLRSALAAALDQAKQLDAIALQLRNAEAQVEQAHQRVGRAVLAQVARELAAPTTTSARRAELLAAQAAVAVVGRTPKRIVLPALEVDPLADPEELDAQAAALRQAETELDAQLVVLARAAARAQEREAVRQAHVRTMEIASRDDDQTRRGPRTAATVRADGELAPAGAPDGTPTGSPSDGAVTQTPTPTLPALADVGIALADVVAKRDAAALSAAVASQDPAELANAVTRAREAALAKRKALHTARLAVEARANSLRKR